MEVMRPIVVVLKNAICFVIFIILQQALTSFAAGDAYAQKRQQMVEQNIRGRGVKDPVVLRAMGTVPRHLFVNASLRSQAYADHPLPIEEDCRPYLGFCQAASAALYHDGGGTITIMVTYEQARIPACRRTRPWRIPA
jgi:hypothetical protein